VYSCNSRITVRVCSLILGPSLYLTFVPAERPYQSTRLLASLEASQKSKLRCSNLRFPSPTPLSFTTSRDVECMKKCIIICACFHYLINSQRMYLTLTICSPIRSIHPLDFIPIRNFSLANPHYIPPSFSALITNLPLPYSHPAIESLNRLLQDSSESSRTVLRSWTFHNLLTF
jgi:hypothetical protein